MSDRGRQFESKLWSSLISLLGIQCTSNVLFPHKTTVCLHLIYRRALQQATHVYVRHDAVKSAFQRPYDGPFLVIQRTDKFFTLNTNGCRDTVSINRLKPAFLEKRNDPPLKPTTHPMTPVSPDAIEPLLPTVLPTPSLTTRSGRT
ncbi:Hypothetical predicted protein, partial [Paramuricea clavata]